MDAKQQAIAFLIGRGWTAEQACGIVANLWSESGLRPNAIGDDGAAYGIAQWHSDRQSNFQSVIGKPIRGTTLEEQLYFVHAELQGTEKRAGDALAACKTAAEAGAIVSRLYVRPADREGEAVKRAILAESMFKAYGGTSGTVSEAPPPVSVVRPDVPATQPKE